MWQMIGTSRRTVAKLFSNFKCQPFVELGGQLFDTLRVEKPSLQRVEAILPFRGAAIATLADLASGKRGQGWSGIFSGCSSIDL
jgi:hypothetical protein